MPVTKELHFVFECMEGNLYQLTKSRKGRPLAGGLVASIFQQIIRGLHHIHQYGYFHRDMKPENLLITTTGLADYPASSPLAMPGTPPEKDVLVIVKLADFGLARETLSRPPYTEYVSTRWYRAPEVLLRSRDYSNPVDMWALGTILAEMVNLKPLFPGQSEVDQVLQICEVLGDPTRDYGLDERGRRRGGGEWLRGIRMAKNVGFEFPQTHPITFSTLFSPKVPPSLVDCIQDLLCYDPQQRLTTADCLNHTYFTKIAPRLQPPQARAVVAPTSPEQASDMLRQQARQQHQSLNAATMQVVNGAKQQQQQQQQRSIPPSHSNTNQSTKMPFGVGAQPVGQHSRVPQAVSGDQDTQMEGNSPPYGYPRGDVTFTTMPRRSDRDSTVSQYPAYPDSASSATSHWATHPAADSATDRFGQFQTTQPHPAYGKRSEDIISEEEQNMVRPIEQSQSGGATRYANTTAQTMLERQTEAASNPSLASHVLSANSDAEARHGGVNVSNETIGTKEKRRPKGWGLNISSVLGPGRNEQSQRSEYEQGQQQLVGRTDSSDATRSGRGHITTPAQQIAAEHSTAGASKGSVSAADAKKAKKEAEKAAREAEKAKRAAQERAARERARAVMQKRNQILASSNTRDQVEWLTLAENDMTRALQQQQAQQYAQAQQQAQPQQSHPQQMMQEQQHDLLQSPYAGQGQPVNFTQPQPQYYSHISEKAWGKQPRLSSSTSDHSANSAFSGRIGQPYSPLPNNNTALRSVEAGVEQHYGDPVRQSMMSFQTRESDPGPERGGGRGATYARPVSNTSLNSAPGLIDAASSAAARRSVFPERASMDNVSVASSLDNQLITNMENMTAAESSAHYRYKQGSMSPGPVHLVGNRPSVSRQSHGSRTSSAQRQGSASPMHYTNAPRFHPYSSGGAHGGGGSSVSSHPPHPNYPLPSLAASLAHSGGAAGSDVFDSRQADGVSSFSHTRPRSLSRHLSHGHRGLSQGSAVSQDGAISRAAPGHLPPHQHGQGHGYGYGPGLPTSSGGLSGNGSVGTSINPMFQVPPDGGGAAHQQQQQQHQYQHHQSAQSRTSPPQPQRQQPDGHQPMTVLPPFSALAAATESSASPEEGYYALPTH